jgi:branched-chain amino acid transport system permease protein
MIKKKRIGQIIACAAFAVLAYLIVPKVSGDYILTVTNGALIYFVACLGVSIILGMGGLVSFSSVAFMGIGAYASTNFALKLGFNSIVAILSAVVFTAVAALLIGLILLRLKGTFFTFGTVALTLIMSSVFVNFREVTGGPDGIAGIPAFGIGSLSANGPADNFMVLISVSIVCTLIVIRLRKTNLGRALSSVRDNEIAAQVMGINVYRTKVIAFILEATFSALAGALMVHNNRFVSSSVFVLDQSCTFLIMVMLGGVRSAPGVFLGAILITMLPEWLKPLREYIRLFYGLGVMLLMVFMPMGLAGMVSNFKKKFERRFNLGQKTRIGVANGAPILAGVQGNSCGSFSGEDESHGKDTSAN